MSNRNLFKVEKNNNLDIIRCENKDFTGDEANIEFAIICEWESDYCYYLCDRANLEHEILENLPDPTENNRDSWSLRVVKEDGSEVEWRQVSTITIIED
jgi:hypothetical protein